MLIASTSRCHVLQKQLSVPGAKELAANYKSLEHYLQVDGGTAEDCEDIIATGHLSCTWYAFQHNIPRQDMLLIIDGCAHIHTWLDYLEYKHKATTAATVSGALHRLSMERLQGSGNTLWEISAWLPCDAKALHKP